MKVATSVPARKSAPLTLRRVLKVGLALIVIAVLAAVAVLIVRPEFTQRVAAQLEERWGYAFRSVDAGLMDQWSIALGNYLREARDGVAEVPELAIDVPFKEIRKIYAKREEALARGILVQGPDDFVKGEIRVGERTVPVKLRLKGDWNDHLAGRKWSFRIRTRRGEELFGMRRFSIQNPNTRGYQAELMFFEALDRYGVMKPRYQFVQVMLNGESMGLMALEEFFAKELLEFNRRREGVIVRFDESYTWDSKDAITGEAVGWGGAFDDYRNARVDAFGSTRIAGSATLSKQYRVAEGLLNGFADGTLTASQVFNVEQLGAFLAVADMFGSWHSVAWHNLRFYLNPVTLKLEPIVFDATLQERFTDTRSVINDEPIAMAMLEDPLLLQRYAEVLRDLQAGWADGSLAEQLQAVEAENLQLLQTEFRMLTRLPLDYLGERLSVLVPRAERLAAGDNGAGFHFVDEKERELYAVLAHFEHATDPAELRVETAVPRKVELRSAEWVASDGSARYPALDASQLPLQLPARGIGSEPLRLRLPLLPQPDAATDWQLLVTAGLQGREWSRVHRALPAAGVFSTAALPGVSQLDNLPYLRRDDNLITFVPGDWQVAVNLVTPPGVAVTIPAGTTLRFAADALLLVNGTLRVNGTAEAPVRLLPAGTSWPGIVVMDAPERSLVTHAEFRSTHSVATDNWTLTGGVNFYASDVTISDALFADSRGEDALNIINSRYELNNITIDGTVSDAFDGDFTDGVVNGGLFSNVGSAGGGDAVDVSGSRITVNGTRFVAIADKALSVGEASSMQASGVTIAKVGTGAAAKDGSRLELRDSNIDTASFAGLTAYIKKPEYGPAEIRADGVTIVATDRPVLVQTGSQAVIDGAEATAEDVDVDALYETVMKPGLRR